MDWRTHCAAVIPALNEEGRIGAVVRGVREHVDEVIVVDDGSTDATGAEAEAAGAELVRNENSMGKGESLIRGWSSARRDGFRWALCLDGDGQHDPAECPKFFEAVKTSGAPLIVGNRMAQAQRMPWLRRSVNRWMSRRISRKLGQELPDTQCGFRLMNLEVWDGLRVAASHFEIESAVICAFARGGHDIRFVPIQVIYADERSKIHPVRDTLRWFKWWRTVNSIP